MSELPHLKFIQKLNENPFFWELKKMAFAEFKNSQDQKFFSEEVFQKSLKKTDTERKIMNLIKETLISYKNIYSNQNSDDPINYINEYKKKWLDFLNTQYIHLSQNYYVLSSETKDETIYFYDDQALLNFLSKIQNFPNTPLKNMNNETSILKIDSTFSDFCLLSSLKNYFFERICEEKEKNVEKMLGRNVFLFYFYVF